MDFETAIRATEILLGLALIQQSIEHLFWPSGAWAWSVPRLICAVLLVVGVQTGWALIALVVIGVALLHRFQGPYNGGSDRMGLLVLFCLCLAQILPDPAMRELAFGYLAVQVILSYFISGKVKLENPDWRSGRALQDVFLFSAYPVAENMRAMTARPALLFGASWAVMLFEVMFPLALLDGDVLIIALGVAAVFHLANACLFGLNRFVWVWVSAYPSLIWLQDRIF